MRKHLVHLTKMTTRVTRSASKPASSPITSDISTSQPAKNDVPKKGTKRSAAKVAADSKSMPPPATPPPKRSRKSGPKPSLETAETPTPLEGKLMSGLTSPETIPKLPPLDPSLTPSRQTRPAAPDATNAALATPGGTKHTAYARDVSPSPTLPRPTATTADILTKACAHLCTMEPKLAAVIAAHPCPLWIPESLAQPVDPFASLVSSVCGQQVSGAAAKSIRRKFVLLFCTEEQLDSDPKGTFPRPDEVADADISLLRTAGLSQRKAEYVKGIAEKFASGELSAEWLATASWEELYEKLIAIRGLGQWSVEMFACFALKRLDVFSTGDLGVQRGLASLAGRDVKKLKAKGGGKWKYMSEKDMLEHAEKFRPYRSLFMWYCWRIEDVDVEALAN